MKLTDQQLKHLIDGAPPSELKFDCAEAIDGLCTHIEALQSHAAAMQDRVEKAEARVAELQAVVDKMVADLRHIQKINCVFINVTAMIEQTIQAALAAKGGGK